MKKIPKKYIPFICLAIMLLISWLAESFIFEGKLHSYINSRENLVLRSIIRIFYLSILFLLGYIGLNVLSLKWALQLFIFWNILALICAGIVKLQLILFNLPLTSNTTAFLMTFYLSTFTPFPFIFLWLLYYLTSQRNKP